MANSAIDTREEIPQWVWYVGQFLFQYQESLERSPQQSVQRMFTDFLKSQGLEDFHRVTPFSLKNQGIVLMLLYGLLVIPKEIWGTDDLDEGFGFETRKHFSPCFNEAISDGDMIKKLRNAVAHANLAIDIENNGYKFWNQRHNCRDFEARIAQRHIGEFLGEVGKYYINEVRNKRRP